MKRNFIIFLYLFLSAIFVFAAEPIQLPKEINFDIVLNKTGSDSLYFFDPDTKDVLMSAQDFGLLSGDAETELNLKLGAGWRIFPELESPYEPIPVKIKVQFSDQPELQAHAAYMMRRISEPGENPPPIGLNFSASIENTGDSSVDSIVISGDQVAAELPESQRTLELFSGSVGNGGTTGKKIIALTLVPPKTPDDGSSYYMDGDYRGYIIMYAEVGG